MRASVLTTLLAALPSALAWQITTYRERDCADRDDGFDYYTFEGQGSMPYCWGFEEDHFPDGVACSYFSDGGRSGPHACDGQIDLVKSIKVVRGKVMFWEKYDGHHAQPDDRRCSERVIGFSDVDKAPEGGNIFHEENYRCRNAYYTGGGELNRQPVWKDFRGFRAWD
ncbi:hypothetical protein FALBO_13220 [Fusarium albosuccineum]|uniref:Secreted LysM effector LysM C-terminal domain-containing protein n=1 Tax=Fusarium albosuccineum TaxID=1237068 RepID=A0A8H4L1M7_9HYPO|nr:hypothetical protein FALBO_13220 [Fusarium albosuccineum]